MLQEELERQQAIAAELQQRLSDASDASVTAGHDLQEGLADPDTALRNESSKALLQFLPLSKSYLYCNGFHCGSSLLGITMCACILQCHVCKIKLH